MAVQRTELTRVFEANGVRLPDPNPTMTPQHAVALIAAAGRADLATSEIRGPDQRGNELVYTLHRAVGTKGAGRRTVEAVEPRVPRARRANSEMRKRLAAYTAGGGVAFDGQLLAPLNALSRNDGEQVLVMPSAAVPWLG